VKKPKKPKRKKSPEKQPVQLAVTPEGQQAERTQSFATTTLLPNTSQIQPLQPGGPPLPPPQKKKPRHWLWWVLGIAWTLVILALDQAANLAGIWGPFWPVEPAFAPGIASFSAPFDVPFTVTNKSAFFPILNLNITCYLNDVVLSAPTVTGFRISDTSVRVLATNTLQPLETRWYTCPFRNFGQSGPVNIGDAKIEWAEISFISGYDNRILNGRTSSKSDTFTLNTRTSPPRWMIGKPLQ
jgi:hypothetical protein